MFFSFPEAIQCYHSITGSCSAEIKNFIETKGLEKKEYSIKEMLQITDGSYGSESFKSFFQNN